MRIAIGVAVGIGGCNNNNNENPPTQLGVLEFISRSELAPSLPFPKGPKLIVGPGWKLSRFRVETVKLPSSSRSP